MLSSHLLHVIEEEKTEKKTPLALVSKTSCTLQKQIKVKVEVSGEMGVEEHSHASLSMRKWTPNSI